MLTVLSETLHKQPVAQVAKMWGHPFVFVNLGLMTVGLFQPLIDPYLSDEGGIFIRNIGKTPPDHSAPCSRRPYPFLVIASESQISINYRPVRRSVVPGYASTWGTSSTWAKQLQRIQQASLCPKWAVSIQLNLYAHWEYMSTLHQSRTTAQLNSGCSWKCRGNCYAQGCTLLTVMGTGLNTLPLVSWHS
jgi:hypothetical protein